MLTGKPLPEYLREEILRSYPRPIEGTDPWTHHLAATAQHLVDIDVLRPESPIYDFHNDLRALGVWDHLDQGENGLDGWNWLDKAAEAPREDTDATLE